jgi:BCD family chlorophyll transporter-like MFS transporter
MCYLLALIINVMEWVMKRITLLRLGIFQMTAGGLSVLFLGVLNRVMRIELGLPLFTVTVLVGGGHYLGALIAIPFGYYSDRHTLAGFRRTSYILLGAILVALLLAISPTVVKWLAQDPSVFRTSLSFLFFLLEGIATYVAGTAYLSLITDLTQDSERGQATGLVWTLLMVGIILTGVSSSVVLESFSYNRFIFLFELGAIASIILVMFALWGQEPRYSAVKARPKGRLRNSLKMIAANRQARWFGAFLFISMFSYFMQDVLLEPFGGEVFGLSASATTRFNAYMGVGVVGGMLAGGLRLIPSFGKRRVTAIGIVIMIGAFSGLAGTALVGVASILPLILLFLGLGAGFFTVGGVALMMDMTSRENTGLFVGAWTLLQALAKGPTAIIGGGLQSTLVALGGSPAQAYAGVFILEAVGLTLGILFLRQVVVDRFRGDVESFGSLAVESIQ